MSKRSVINKLFPNRADAAQTPLFIFAGPCVVENRDMILQTAEQLAQIRDSQKMDIIFKASFTKANRSSIESFTGLPLEEALKILEEVKTQFGFKILSDVHEYTDLTAVCDVVDVLQTPAFLVRQSEYLKRVALTGKPVNIKKGQFLSPAEMHHVVTKMETYGNSDLLICERGTSFGYNYLINDFRGMQELLELDLPFVFDATHSVQRPGGLEKTSGGDGKYAPKLAKAAVALGVDGVFLETHPSPSSALSDGPNMIPLAMMPRLLKELKEINALILDQASSV